MGLFNAAACRVKTQDKPLHLTFLTLLKYGENANNLLINIYNYMMGSTVAQWLALSPHSKKALGSHPSRSFQVLSVWSLHVLPVPAWVYSGYSGSPHHHKDMHCIV